MAPPPSCPSVPTFVAGARVFGVVIRPDGERRIGYLPEAIAPERLEWPDGNDEPGSVFRVSAPCEEQCCVHFYGDRCRLGARVVAELQPVSPVPPPCAIRDTCRWHLEHGLAACVRCPQVVTRPGLSKQETS